MINCKYYIGHEPDIVGNRKKVDNNIYTFDIETTSYYILNGEQYPSIEYDKLTDKEKKQCIFCSTMYIWMFGINDTVYYGRTWDEFIEFIEKFDSSSEYRKIVFIHNLSYEFQFLKSYFDFDVMARKSRKVMKAVFCDYNIELRCSYMMSNCSLAKLSEVFCLDVSKKVGDLDYNKIRSSITPLTDTELGYCEYDCLVVYKYIQKELDMYEKVYRIPLTSTGHVRREFKELIATDWKYKATVKKAINTNPHIFNLLYESFGGGYTHANFIYADEIIENVISKDETSAYPYTLVTHKFPSSEFRICNIKSHKQMSRRLAYLLRVKFKNIKCKYYNNFISASKCRNIKKARYDNGRIISAEELEITLTDIDFYFILDTYRSGEKDLPDYDIEECYFANYNYLPKTFINFVLDKYEDKTKYKNVEGKELEYSLAKNLYNALYGMSVTCNIRDKVIYDNKTKEWREEELTNQEIIDALEEEKKHAFLSFAYGVWVTAYARDNLLRCVIKNDEYCLYCDTDSQKLKEGYNEEVFTEYNENVVKRIKEVSEYLDIPFEKFAPKDINGESHMLGLWELDGKYEEFVTQGAKKYAYIKYKKNKKLKEDDNIIERGETESKVLEITVSGVPKKGANCLSSLEDFKDDLIFNYDVTGKNLLMYTENQNPFDLVDYLGNKYTVTDISGVCLLPNTYKLSKSYEYMRLLTDSYSERAIFKE